MAPAYEVVYATAQLGNLAEADVEIFQVQDDGELKLMFHEKTSNGDLLEEIGKFDLHLNRLEDERFYVYKVRGGYDWDIEDDGLKDENGTLNKGFIRAIAKGKDIIALGDAFRVTVASEIIFLKCEQQLKHQFDPSSFEALLDAEATLLMSDVLSDADLNADGVVTYMDTLIYDPVYAKESLTKFYKLNMSHSVRGIHRGRTAISMLDSGYPNISLNGSYEMTILVNTPFIDPGANVTDDKDAHIIVFTEGAPDTSIVGSYVVSYHAIDSAGNVATVLKRTVHVVDAYPSLITLNGDQQWLIKQDANVTDPGAQARSSLGTSLDVNVSRSIDTTTIGSYNIRYEAVDESGQHLSIDRTVHIVLASSTDVKPPVMYSYDNNISIDIACDDSGSGYSLYYHNVNAYDEDDRVIDPYLIGMDTDYDDLEVYGAIAYITSKGKDKVDYRHYGSYPIYYAARDRTGNYAETMVMINVVNKAPVMWLYGIGSENNTTTTSYLDTPYEDKGGYAFDECGEPIEIKITSTVDTTKVGQYLITYEAVDALGAKTTRIKTVYIVADTTAPTIYLNGPSTITLQAAQPYVEAVTVYDRVDKNVIVHIDGRVDTTQAGTYVLTYSATDASGNVAQTRTRTVVVLADTTPPVIKVNGSTSMTITRYSTYKELGATAKDVVDGVVAVSMTGSVNMKKAGTYTIRYSAQDKAGNQSQATRTVRVVVPDTTPPRISYSGDIAYSVPKGQYVRPNATATDNIDGAVSVSYSYGNGIAQGYLKNGSPGSEKGVYVLIYTAYDKAGNRARKFRYIYYGLSLGAVNLQAVMDRVQAVYGQSY